MSDPFDGILTRCGGADVDEAWRQEAMSELASLRAENASLRSSLETLRQERARAGKETRKADCENARLRSELDVAVLRARRGAAECLRLGEENARLREALEECAEWLESRPGMDEGDAATSSMVRAALAGQRDCRVEVTQEQQEGEAL